MKITLNVSKIQLRKFTSAFNCLDRNRNGVLDWDDFNRSAEFIREAQGWEASDARFKALVGAQKNYWDKMLELCDADGDNEITYPEFVWFHEKIAAEIEANGKVPPWALSLCHDYHRALDTDGSGSISVDEYALYLRSIGSDADANEAFKHLDIDGSGALSIDELEELYSQFVMSEDPDSRGNWLWAGRF